MIRHMECENTQAFILGTMHTTYCFRITSTGHPEHLYYGASLGDPEKLTNEDILAMSEKKEFEEGNMVVYDGEHKNCTLENMCLEMSSYGKGDIREPFIEIRFADGSSTCDFLYKGAEIDQIKEEYQTLPGSYFSGEGCDHLKIILVDRNHSVSLELHYYVYEKSDVLTRSAKVINQGDEPVCLKRIMSTQLDLSDSGYEVRSFNGAWAREMNIHDTEVRAGSFVNASFTGTSSNRANPFVILHEKNASEEAGKCYGFHLIYSGNHYECIQVNAYGKTRVVTGINPAQFSFMLPPEGFFEAPEAVMSFSGNGYGELSRHLHRFIRNHIVRGEWKDKVRPVLLNSWEAAYFNISEGKLLKLAKAAKEAGVELFVMDDGWFGNRSDDAHSLGDWYVNKEKLPGGLLGLSKKINALGLSFGIWVEPEMISVNSRLYEKHPDWAMEIPGQTHSEGRNQRILDLCNPKVCEFIIRRMTRLFASAPITYVKWDMNRIFSDVYSPYLEKKEREAAKEISDGQTSGRESSSLSEPYLKGIRQGEVFHRYMIGLYRIMKILTMRFPKILFEGCASGGNRFDLGILCYFPQIWASDNTDAICRSHIQEGISFGYPMNVMTSHLSASPNHQTLRTVNEDTRFAVAVFGVFGLECNLADMSDGQREAIADMISLYKAFREVLQKGTFYRGRTGNIHEWTCVSEDRKRAVGMVLQELVVPNWQYETYTAKGLDPDCRYRFYNLEKKHDIRKFGDLINTVAPIHVRQDSALHHVIAKFVTMPGECEETIVSGRVLMQSGIKLKPAFSGTGYNENTRYFQDFASRLYFMEAVEE